MSKNIKKKNKEVAHPDYYLMDLEKHRDKSKEYRDYATKRFDILVITISTVGLGFVANYIKDDNLSDKTLPYLSIGLFGLCLLLNLFAQIFSRITNNLALKRAEYNLYFHRYDEYPNKLTAEEFNQLQGSASCKINRWNLMIKTLDWISLAFLLVAIVLFLCFTFSF